MVEPGNKRVPEKQVKRAFRNIKVSPDGSDFINYLHWLAYDNYKAWLSSGEQDERVHKGIAIAIDNMLSLFANCDKESANESTNTSWSF